MLVLSVAAIVIGFVVIVALIGISGGLGNNGTSMPAVAAADIPAPVLRDVSARQQAVEQITTLLRGWNVAEEGLNPLTDPFYQST